MMLTSLQMEMGELVDFHSDKDRLLDFVVKGINVAREQHGKKIIPEPELRKQMETSFKLKLQIEPIKPHE